METKEQIMTLEDVQKIIQAKALCDRGFAAYNSKYYDEIDALLEQVEQTERIQGARRMAKAGPTLSSPRFAYPHIESMLEGVLQESRNASR